MIILDIGITQIRYDPEIGYYFECSPCGITFNSKRVGRLNYGEIVDKVNNHMKHDTHLTNLSNMVDDYGG